MLTPDQEQARQGKITSSVAAAALGLNPRMTPLEAYLRVTGQLRGTNVETKAIERGNRLEELVLDYPADKLNLTRKPAPFRKHPEFGWAGDSCDALYYRDDQLMSVGEGKTAGLSIGTEYGEEGTDEIPESTLVQSHWHLLHWPEVDTCHVPVLVGGYQFEFRLYKVKRDAQFEGMIVEDLARWHRDHVVAQRPPPAEAGDTDWIAKQLARYKPGKNVPDSPQVRELVKAKLNAAQARKAAEADEARANNRLKMLLGEAETCRAYWGTIHYKPQKRAVIDWKAIAREYGCTDQDIQRHTTIKPTARILRIYPKQGAKL